MFDHVLADIDGRSEGSDAAYLTVILAEVTVDAQPGAPPEEPIALSDDVDLLVIGAPVGRRSSRAARETGERLLHEARWAVVVVPPAPSTSRRRALHHHGRSEREVSGALP